MLNRGAQDDVVWNRRVCVGSVESLDSEKRKVESRAGSNGRIEQLEVRPVNCGQA